MKRSLFRPVAALCLLCAAVFTACTRGNVSLSEDDQTYTLDNGLVTAVVAKASGDLVSRLKLPSRSDEMPMVVPSK